MSPLVSVLVSFPTVLDRFTPFAHGGGERYGWSDAPGGRASDDLLSGRTRKDNLKTNRGSGRSGLIGSGEYLRGEVEREDVLAPHETPSVDEAVLQV